MSDGGTRQALRLNGRQRCLHAQQEAGGWEMDGWIRGPPQSGSALLSSYLTAGSPLSTALAYTYDGNIDGRQLLVPERCTFCQQMICFASSPY
ncbi:unnamed protein product [Clonostachys rosea f. rosea IK726]|uniref:Uncharacterized protein n=1 Tax=Clonostachys rosea f. rosea IK726 TaxID=1349383 RepID=A0ACA9UNP4_BIOOC|nr:unnamed protein product [Clonostachys rosea f. rosea IK726]